MASSSSSGIKPIYPSLLDELLINFCMIMHFEWDTITYLSQTQDVDELDWLLRLFTTCDPYLESNYPFDWGDYLTVITYLVDLDTWVEDEDTEAIYALEDKDFIALDMVDRGIGLGLPPGLYDILLPRGRPQVSYQIE